MKRDKTGWHFLINPAAGRGKAWRKWQQLLPELQLAFPDLTWAASTPEEGMAALAAAEVRAGRTHLVGVGGDGTHHDILNGIVAANGLGQVTYAPLPVGTGNDWVRTLKTPRGLARWVAMLRAGKTMEHGVGRLNYHSREGTPATRCFCNVAGLAYDAEVVRRSETARFKHRFLYPFLTLWYLKDFQVPTVRIDYDGQTFTGPVHTVNLGIGRYSGGGMRLVPQADPSAATLALTYARQLPVWKVIAESWRFYTGTVNRVKEVTATHAEKVVITPVGGKLEVEADGEWLGVGPVTAGLLHEKLRVIVPT